MLSPDVEAERCRAVEQLYLIDTAPEERFAQITRMARYALEVPMAAISLLDRDRQWFKQIDGLDVSSSVPRPQTGYPLYGPGGHAVGTFCIYDTKPRALSCAQRQTFAELAARAQRELQSTDAVERAATVQRQQLPPTVGDLPGYTVRALCLPAYAVGGDFYDHYPVRGGVIVTVVDVMGKGLGAVILTAILRSALRGGSRAVELAGCDTVQQLCGDGLPLGVLPDDRWTTQNASLQPGDSLVVASNGMLDLLGNGDDLGAALRFVARHADPDDLWARALALSQPTLDDITIVVTSTVSHIPRPPPTRLPFQDCRPVLGGVDVIVLSVVFQAMHCRGHQSEGM